MSSFKDFETTSRDGAHAGRAAQCAQVFWPSSQPLELEGLRMPPDDCLPIITLEDHLFIGNQFDAALEFQIAKNLERSLTNHGSVPYIYYVRAIASANRDIDICRMLDVLFFSDTRQNLERQEESKELGSVVSLRERVTELAKKLEIFSEQNLPLKRSPEVLSLQLERSDVTDFALSKGNLSFKRALRSLSVILNNWRLASGAFAVARVVKSTLLPAGMTIGLCFCLNEVVSSASQLVQNRIFFLAGAACFALGSLASWVRFVDNLGRLIWPSHEGGRPKPLFIRETSLWASRNPTLRTFAGYLESKGFVHEISPCGRVTFSRE